MRGVVKCTAFLLTISVACAAVASATSDSPLTLTLSAAASASAAAAAILVWTQFRSDKSSGGRGTAPPPPAPPKLVSGTPREPLDGPAAADAAEALLRGEKGEAGFAVGRVQDQRLKSALEGVMRCWDTEKAAGSSPAERLQVCQRAESAERRAVAQAEDETWQRSDSKRRLSARALDWGTSTSPSSSPKSAMRRASPPGSPSRTAVVSSRPGSQTSAPGQAGRRHSVLSSKGKSTHAAGEAASSGADSGSGDNERRQRIALSPGESGSNSGRGRLTKRNSESIIGRACEDSSGSDSSSEEGTATRARPASTLLTRVVYRNASSTAAPGQASGVVRGARQFRKRSSSSSGEEEAKDALSTALRQKPKSVELFRAQLTEVPSSVTTTLAATTTALDISNNTITELPEALSSMVSLTKLNVSSNQILTLPNAVSALPALEVLQAQHNQIAALPQTFTAPLREVNLAWNALPTFPEQLLLPTLRNLNISENAFIHHLPPREVLQTVCKDCTIRLDNEPSLKEGASSLAEKGPSFEWNGVFPDRVVPGLYLGSLRSAQDRVYERLHITHVATIGRELDVRPPPHIAHLKISVDDVADEDIRSLLSEAHEFIQRAREEDGACFVHCFKGQSRSATVVISYLMVTEKMSMAQALQTVRAVRPMIRPNEGFLLQIARLGEVLESDHDRGKFGDVSLASSAHSSHRRSASSNG
eukprot:Hpha_TRINITY_DN16641_c2_g14::TRINITY_DN16641_c2_g14_i1::g.178430::m.178430